ncbi:MAG: bfd [Blastococcus sp.]|jgi:bacterioferritin-associated ferredoxin|nr:bfd [Blastococcus sp.]
MWTLFPFGGKAAVMYVCHCNVVTDRDIMESIANGARCVADVARDTGAGRTCGNCISSLRDLVCQHCPVRAERNTSGAVERELGVAGAAR